MSYFDGGWIKLHRKITDSWIGRDIITLGLFTKLLLWANYKESKILFDGQITIVKPGQIVTSIRALAERLEVDRSTISRRLYLLEQDKTIELKTSHRSTIITICNWSQYQENKNQCEPVHSQSSTTEPATRPATRPSHSEEGNKVTNKERKKLISKASFSESDQKLGIDWAEYTKAEWPFTNPDPTKFAEAIAKAKKATGLNDEQMRFLFEFVKRDDFWRPNCQSPAGLLKKGKNDMRKIDNILAKIKQKHHTSTGVSAWLNE